MTVPYDHRYKGKPIIAAVVESKPGSYHMPDLRNTLKIKLLRATCGRTRHGLVEVILGPDDWLAWPNKFVFHALTGEPFGV